MYNTYCMINELFRHYFNRIASYINITKRDPQIMSKGTAPTSNSARLLILCATLAWGLILTGCTQKHEAYVSASTQIRDNTPECLVPEAPGIIVFENELASIDASNSSEGYLMACYFGDCMGIKLQITGPDSMPYTYDLTNSKAEAFPLSAGDGEYLVNILENVEGTQYATALSACIEVKIDNSLGAYLYPNQYVSFNKDSKTVSLGADIVKEAHDDLEAIGLVYNYLINNITYDVDKAQNIQSGYIPEVDSILDSRTGICLDYSAVMCSMLRSQKIPCRMEVGYAGTVYHAWISTYVENVGWINGIVQFDGSSWSIMDPTVAANSGEEALKSFIGDGGGYYTKFIY